MGTPTFVMGTPTFVMGTPRLILLVAMSFAGWSLIESSDWRPTAVNRYYVSLPSKSAGGYACSTFKCAWKIQKMRPKAETAQHGGFGRSPIQLHKVQGVQRPLSTNSGGENGHPSRQRPVKIFSAPSRSVSQSQGYQAPSSRSASQSQGYQAPSSGPAAQSQEYQAPSSRSASQSQGYQAPSSRSASQSQGYQAPSSRSASQSQGYQAPSSRSASQSQGYQAPSSRSAAQSQGYQALSSRSASQSQGYQAPSSRSASQSQGYQAPSSRPAAQSQGYQAPSSRPAAQSQEYQAPSSRSASQSQGYQAPSSFVTDSFTSSSYDSLPPRVSSSVLSAPSSIYRHSSYSQTSSPNSFLPSSSLNPSSSSKLPGSRYQRASPPLPLPPYLSRFLNLHTTARSPPTVASPARQREYPSSTPPSMQQSPRDSLSIPRSTQSTTYSQLAQSLPAIRLPLEKTGTFLSSDDPTDAAVYSFLSSNDTLLAFLTPSHVRSAMFSSLPSASSIPSASSLPSPLRTPDSSSDSNRGTLPYPPSALASYFTYPFQFLNISSLSEIPTRLSLGSFPFDVPASQTEEDAGKSGSKSLNPGDNNTKTASANDELISAIDNLFIPEKMTEMRENAILKESPMNSMTDILQTPYANESKSPKMIIDSYDPSQNSTDRLITGTEWMKFITKYFKPISNSMKNTGESSKHHDDFPFNVLLGTNMMSNLASRTRHKEDEEKTFTTQISNIEKRARKDHSQQEIISSSQTDALNSNFGENNVFQLFKPIIPAQNVNDKEDENKKTIQKKNSWLTAEIDLGSMGVLTLGIGDYLNDQMYLDVDINTREQPEVNNASSSINNSESGSLISKDTLMDALSLLKNTGQGLSESNLSQENIDKLRSWINRISSNTQADAIQSDLNQDETPNQPFQVHLSFSSPVNKTMLIKLSNILKTNTSGASIQNLVKPLINLNVTSGRVAVNANSSDAAKHSRLTQAYYYYHGLGQQAQSQERNRMGILSDDSLGNQLNQEKSPQDDSSGVINLWKVIPTLNLNFDNETRNSLYNESSLRSFMKNAISFWNSALREVNSGDQDRDTTQHRPGQRPPLPAIELTAPSRARALESYGRSLEAYTRPLEAYAKPLNANARPLEAYMRPLDAYVRPLEAYARPLEAYARPLEAPMRPMEKPVRPLEAPIRPMEKPARPLEMPVSPLEVPVSPLVTYISPLDQLIKPLEAFINQSRTHVNLLITKNQLAKAYSNSSKTQSTPDAMNTESPDLPILPHAIYGGTPSARPNASTVNRPRNLRDLVEISHPLPPSAPSEAQLLTWMLNGMKADRDLRGDAAQSGRDSSNDQQAAWKRNRDQQAAWDRNRDQQSTWDRNRDQQTAWERNRNQQAVLNGNIDRDSYQQTDWDRNRKQEAVLDRNRHDIWDTSRDNQAMWNRSRDSNYFRDTNRDDQAAWDRTIKQVVLNRRREQQAGSNRKNPQQAVWDREINLGIVGEIRGDRQAGGERRRDFGGKIDRLKAKTRENHHDVPVVGRRLQGGGDWKILKTAGDRKILKNGGYKGDFDNGENVANLKNDGNEDNLTNNGDIEDLDNDGDETNLKADGERVGRQKDGDSNDHKDSRGRKLKNNKETGNYSIFVDKNVDYQTRKDKAGDLEIGGETPRGLHGDQQEYENSLGDPFVVVEAPDLSRQL